MGIPPAPRGVPQIEVSFDIDANGIVHVSAKDLGTGKVQNIEVKVSSGLSEDQIERMIQDAQEHAAEDEAKRQSVRIRNEAEILVYSTEQTLQEHADKIDEEDIKRLRELIKKRKKE